MMLQQREEFASQILVSQKNKIPHLLIGERNAGALEDEFRQLFQSGVVSNINFVFCAIENNKKMHFFLFSCLAEKVK
jgi:hypothetical protein